MKILWRENEEARGKRMIEILNCWLTVVIMYYKENTF